MYIVFYQLTEVDLGGGGTAYYVYSGGQRVRKVIENGTLVKDRLYLGNNEIYREKISGNLDLERKTLHISDDQNRIAIVDTKTYDGGVVGSPTNEIRYQMGNHLQSASLELDNSAVVISYDETACGSRSPLKTNRHAEQYHPFGTSAYRLGRTSTEVSQKRYRYVGKECDNETGLYYYGARYYAAWLGKFISVDPKKDDYPMWSSFVYAGNMPVTMTDVNGEGPGGGEEDPVVDSSEQSQDEKQKVTAYVNPKIDEYKVGVEKHTKSLADKREEYIKYYRDVVKKLDSDFTEDEFQSVLSDEAKSELARIQGLLERNKDGLIRAVNLQKQWNRLDQTIENVVFDFNKREGLTGDERLDPNLVKAVMFSESELGTGYEYTKRTEDLIDYTDKYGIYEGYEYHQFNIGGVTDESLYSKTVKHFEIPVDSLTNFRDFGNINDVKLTAGALILKFRYAKNVKSNENLNGNDWYNAVVAFKGASKKGKINADNVFKLYNKGMHPHTPNFRLFNP